MYLGQHFKYLGGSSVACLSLTVLTSLFWEKGIPPYLNKGALLAHCTASRRACCWLSARLGQSQQPMRCQLEACLSLTVLTALLWEKGIPPYLNKGALLVHCSVTGYACACHLQGWVRASDL